MYDLIGEDGGGGDELDQLVGYEEIVSGDELDDVGAVVRAARQGLARQGIQANTGALLRRVAQEAERRGNVRAQIDKMRLKNAVGVVPQRFSKQLVLPVPFESIGTVAALATTTIAIQAPLVWKPERLFIGTDIGGSFTLDRLQVALQSWLLTTAPVPCQIFGQDATDNMLRLETLQIGQQLVMSFTNRSGAALQLRGVWKGIVLS